MVGNDRRDENDAVSLVSIQPVMHFHDPPPPVWDIGEDQEVEDITEVIHEDATFAEGHYNAAQEYVDLAVQELDRPELAWTAITFGLGLIDLGRRDVGFDPRHVESLPEKIQELWWDHARYGDLTINTLRGPAAQRDWRGTYVGPTGGGGEPCRCGPGHAQSLGHTEGTA